MAVVGSTRQVHAPVRRAGGRNGRMIVGLALIVALVAFAAQLLDLPAMLWPNLDPDAAVHAWWRPGPDAVAAQPAAAEPPGEDPELRILKDRVVGALLAGETARAHDMIRRQMQDPEIYPYPEALAELAALTAEAARVDERVADALREKLNQTIVLRVKDRRYTLIPRAVAGTRLHAILVPRDPSAPRQQADFEIGELPPDERDLWLGPATTPARAVMKLLLRVSAGDRDGARLLAPDGGPLADAFRRALEPGAP